MWSKVLSFFYLFICKPEIANGLFLGVDHLLKLVSIASALSSYFLIIFSWKTQSETSYEVNIRDYGQILDDFYNKIILNNNNSITIAIVTHSQIMNQQDWNIFGKLIMTLKKTKIEQVKIHIFIQ